MKNYQISSKIFLFFILIHCTSIAFQAYGHSVSKQFYNDLRQIVMNKYYESKQIHTEPNKKQPPTPVLIKNWPHIEYNFGQITAVAVDPRGYPAIFHRASRIWDKKTFNSTNHYQHVAHGPIEGNTIILLNPLTGVIEYAWGGFLFFMPHGMTIDVHGNYWTTDIALHQVFKFKVNHPIPILTFGKKFQPGSSINHLCKPTAVAVATTGEVFISDGYCNERILKYNAAGRLLRTIPQPPEFLSLQIPHGITLLEHLDLLCIADRENMRVVCPKAGLKSSVGEGQPASTIQEPDLGRVFDVAAYGGMVFAINGPTSPMLPTRGFTIDPRSEAVLDYWGVFQNPHSIAIANNGSALYVSEIGPNRVWKFELI